MTTLIASLALDPANASPIKDANKNIINEGISPIRKRNSLMTPVPNIYHQDAWLNAIIGRLFVSLHTSPRIRNYLLRMLNRDAFRETSKYLTDLRVDEIEVGECAPTFSKMRLINVDVHGDLQIEVNVEYAGGLNAKAAATALVPLPHLTSFVNPMEIPIEQRYVYYITDFYLFKC